MCATYILMQTIVNELLFKQDLLYLYDFSSLSNIKQPSFSGRLISIGKQ